MNEIWVKVKGFSNYKISNMGNIVNIKTNKLLKIQYVNSNNYAMITLYKNKQSYNKGLAKLVIAHFQVKELDKDFALHLDLNHMNNKNVNLKQASRGDIYRYYYTVKKQKRGVYKWTDGFHVKWRAMIKVNNKPLTIGYTKTKKQAEMLYKQAFKSYYGYLPY